MNVALVVPEFPPDIIGGGGPVFESLALALHARGNTVRILTSATHGGPRARDDAYPFPVMRVRQFRHFTSQFRAYMPPLPQDLGSVAAFLRSCDVVNLHGYGTPFIDVVFNVFCSPARSVFTTHGFLHTIPSRGGPLAAAYTVYDRLFGSRVLRLSARATAVSSLLAREAEIRAGRPVGVIPNGLVPMGDAAGLEPWLAAEVAKGPYVIGVGRLEDLKGFHLLVEAAAQLRRESLPLRVILAGADNGRKDALTKLARECGLADNLVFAGRLSRGELATLYAGARVAAVTSVTESFSLVTLEAMQAGIPCVLSAVGGILDIARDEGNALLFPAGNVPALISALRRAWSDDALRARISGAGRYTAQRFTWSEVACAYENVYGSIR